MPRTSLSVSFLSPPETILVLLRVRHTPTETSFILPSVSYFSCLTANVRLVILRVHSLCISVHFFSLPLPGLRSLISLSSPLVFHSWTYRLPMISKPLSTVFFIITYAC